MMTASWQSDQTYSFTIIMLAARRQDRQNTQVWRSYHLQLLTAITQFTNTVHTCIMPSVLWRCWLGGRKGIRPVKNRVVGCTCGCLSGAKCRLAYGPADATATQCLLLQLIQIGFTFLVPAHPGSTSPGQRAVKRVCVCTITLKLTGWGRGMGRTDGR